MGQEVGLLLSSVPPPPRKPRLTCLHSSALIWRSQGFPLLSGVQTLSPSQQSKKAGPTHWNSLDLTLTIHLLLESHVCSRVPLEPLAPLKLGFAEDWDCLACLPGSASEGKGFFFLIEMSGSEGEGGTIKKRGRMMTGLTE